MRRGDLKNTISAGDVQGELANIKTLLYYAEREMKKRFENSNISAGKRSRKAMRAVKRKLHDLVLKFVEFEKQI